MGDIFISYKREEVSTARQVSQALHGERLDVWWDENLQGGQQWAEEIDKALLSAAVVVVLWSAASVQSDWVKHEASIAKSRGTLVPVIIAPCSIPPAFERTQCVPLAGWDGSERNAGFRDLLSAVLRVIRRRRRARIRSGIAMGVTACILFGLGILAGRHVLGPKQPASLAASMRPSSGASGTHSAQEEDLSVDEAQVRGFFGPFCMKENSGVFATCGFTTLEECQARWNASPAGPFKANHSCVSKPSEAYCFAYRGTDSASRQVCLGTSIQCESTRSGFRRVPTVFAVAKTCQAFVL
jgi:hypothetical protein